MLPPKQNAAYRAFYDSARHNAILDPKTTYLLHLACAMSAGCAP